MKKRDIMRAADPHREREASRYVHPIPSRELTLQTLAEAGVPLTDEELAQRLAINPKERDAFAKRLGAMERDGQILRNRKGAILVAAKLDLVAGRVEGHPDGYGFVIPEEGEDLYLSPHEMRKVLHGDRVMVRESGVDRRGRKEGTIVEVIERVNHRVVGRLHGEGRFLFVQPAERRISQTILIAPEDAGGARPGQVVVAELTVQPDGHTQPIGRVVEVLGEAADPGIEIEIARRKHELPFKFSARAEALAAGFPSVPRPEDLAGREDLRSLELVTIDGETARDFDDAVYCEKTSGGFRLVVAIADVSHYVRDGDALDLEARERGNSVYFPRRVIPMLPEQLSNGLCSLNAEVDRLCMACDMTIGPKGKIGAYRFYPAVMRSRARLTYTEVAAALADPRSEASRKLKGLLPRLQLLKEVFGALLKAREERGAIDFETIETQFVFDGEGRLARIEKVERNDAHRIIEECMLAANVCASDILSKRKPPAKHYAKLLETVRKRPDVQLLQTVLLRSLQQAQYSPENVGHFGLAYEHYTHFTSPIRRYPDLLIHRAIKAVHSGGRYNPGNWSVLGSHCSQTERRADEATREVAAWLKCYYMRDRVGEEFEGSVSAVTSFGIFVALDDFYVEGLVHISELGQDYFHFDAAKHQLLGDRTRKVYRLADRVKVKIVRVDLETSRIDFVLAGESAADSTTGPRHRSEERRVGKECSS